MAATNVKSNAKSNAKSKAKSKAKTTRKTAAKKSTRSSTARKSPAKRTAVKKAKSVKRPAARRKASKSSQAVNFNSAEEVAKSVWFAGLGAYGASYDELKASYAKVNEQSQKLFLQLVKRGEKLQGDAESVIKQQRDTVEDRISDARKSVNELVDKIDVNGRVKQVLARVESLSDDLKKAV